MKRKKSIGIAQIKVALKKYQRAYKLLMEYYDYLDDDDKAELNNKLLRLGL